MDSKSKYRYAGMKSGKRPLTPPTPPRASKHIPNIDALTIKDK